MDVSLEGKVALVTGAGPNIGSGIALALARYGARVACNDIKLDAAHACAARIERNGGTALALTGDVSDEDDVTSYIGQVLSTWGRIDILINNAALLGGRGILEESLEYFNRAVTVAASGNFLNARHAAIAMIERGIRGSIVSILSSNAWQGAPGFIAYAFHKGGLANFVIAARRAAGLTSLRPPPPPMDRPRWWRPVGTFDVRGNIPMGVPATPTDIGHCVAWMCSDYARLITGCDFVIDGGARAKYWGYTPPADNAGPVPLIRLDITEPDGAADWAADGAADGADGSARDH